MAVKPSICVFTSYAANAEPRAVKHAVALAGAFDDHVVHFVDCLPRGSNSTSSQNLQTKPHIVHDHCFFPYRASGLPRLLYERSVQCCSRGLFTVTRRMSPAVLSMVSRL